MSRAVNKLKEEIVGRLDIKAYYERYITSEVIQDTSDGWSKRILCPIHNDTTTPNFFVNIKTGGFKCHSCGKGGSIFDFEIIISGGVSSEDINAFKLAVKKLGRLAGINVNNWIEKYKKENNLNTSKDKKSSSKTSSTTSKKTNKNPVDNSKKKIDKLRESQCRINKADATDSSSKPISKSKVEGYNKALSNIQYKYLNESRGFTLKTINDYLIGWAGDKKGKTVDGNWFTGRFSIPIPGKDGLIRNVRYHSNKCDPSFKMINETGYGKPVRLFCLDRLLKEEWDTVIICEGEWDCILLNQELKKFGLDTWGAVTGTHGAKTFENEWLEYLYGKSVYFCYDCDEAGKTAASGHVTKYFMNGMRAGKFKSVKVLDLGLDGSKEFKDITDFFIKLDYKIEDFFIIANETEPLIPGGVNDDEATVEPIEIKNFVDAIKDRTYIDKRIKVPLTISGQSNRVYHAIRSYKIAWCPMMDAKKDGECCSEDGGECYIPYGHELFIQSCMSQRGSVLKELSRVACQNGQNPKIEPIKKVVMEEYFAHQVVKRMVTEKNEDGRFVNAQELIQAPVYVLQPPENIVIGPHNYTATGWIRTDPRSQQAAFFVENLESMEDDWKKFALENESCRKAIQEIKDDWTVDEIIESITYNITNIYEADDILYAILLTYLSPLMINFNGEIMRGWINSAVIGDTGTGKSDTFNRISDWLELGDSFSILSGARTGLLYAIKQRAGEWHVSIGRYVQASGKIIAVDETQETTPEDIKKMAIAMDKGWLEVSQVASGGYSTQTRTIFLMNPKRGKTISDFTHGCDALRECFDPMFIRRLDIAVFTANRHDYEFYNRVNKKLDKCREIPDRLFRSLVYWAWTRNIDNIIWGEESTKRCLDSATKLSEVYGYADEIPLVNPQDFRNNLARLSTAYAILDRNFTDDLKSVVILPRHVDAMVNLIDQIYSSSFCNLRQRSKHSKKRNTLDDYEKIKKAFEGIVSQSKFSANPVSRSSDHFVQLLLLIQQVEHIRKRELKEQLGVSMRWIQRRIALLQAFNLLAVHRNGYKATRKFNLFMQQWQKEEGVEEMLDDIQTKLGTTANLDSFNDDIDDMSMEYDRVHSRRHVDSDKADALILNGDDEFSYFSGDDPFA